MEDIRFTVYKIKKTDLRFSYDRRENRVMENFRNWLYRNDRLIWDPHYGSISLDELDEKPDVKFIG